jgi:arsenite methyltransferase
MAQLKFDAAITGTIQGIYQKRDMVRRRRLVREALGAARGERILDVGCGPGFRALRPGGRAVVWDIDWATVWWHSYDPERMQRVLRAWDEHLVHPSLPRTLAAQMRTAGFEDVRLQGHSFATVDFDPEAFGVAMMGLIGEFVRGRAGLTEDEAEAWAAEQADLGERGEFFFEGTQFCFTGRKTA